eukprot:1419764-Alexandrium_andersonii.AAC.1
MRACSVRWAWPNGGNAPRARRAVAIARGLNEDRREAPAQQPRPKPRPQPRVTEGDAKATDGGGRPPPEGGLVQLRNSAREPVEWRPTP